MLGLRAQRAGRADLLRAVLDGVAGRAAALCASSPGAPSPGLAAFLGLIPGVGAMYNGQFIKGLVHVVIFAVLVSAAHVYGIFGLFIAGWIFYQVFEAYHTAKARRDGEPLPDPLGLNEVGNWFSPGGRAQQGPQPGPRAGHSRKRKRALGRVRQGRAAGPGSVSSSVPGSVSGTVRAAGVYRTGHSTDSAYPARAAGALAAPGADRGHDSDCPGIAVSGGADGLVLRPAVSVQLAGTADRFGRVADRAAPAGHA